MMRSLSGVYPQSSTASWKAETLASYSMAKQDLERLTHALEKAVSTTTWKGKMRHLLHFLSDLKSRDFFH
jgi:hypothetical protein